MSEWAPIALAFAAGTVIILSAYKPGTYRRRFAALGFGCGAYAVEQFLTRNSASSPENMIWNIREVKDARFPIGLSRIFPWYQTITYAGGTGSPAHERRRDALRKLQSHVSNETVLKYLERERMYDDHTSECNMFRVDAATEQSRYSTGQAYRISVAQYVVLGQNQSRCRRRDSHLFVRVWHCRKHRHS